MAVYDPSLARLLVTLMNVQERELARIAKILHDDVGQTMSAVGLQLDVLRMDLAEKVPEVALRTTEIQRHLEGAIDRVRNLSSELNPGVTEKAGFQFAIERLVGRYREKFPGNLRLMMDVGERLPVSVSTALYKIADQALGNAVEHAQTGQIEVLVRPGQKGTVLEIIDRGKGFDVNKTRDHVPGLGLLLMEYYASQANIQLTITSSPKDGTIVRALHSSSASTEKRRGANAR